MQLSEQIERSDSLWSNSALRARVLGDAIPPSLAALVGGADVVCSRLPSAYVHALFGSRLASRYVYACGLHAPDFAFFDFVTSMQAAAPARESKAGATVTSKVVQ